MTRESCNIFAINISQTNNIFLHGQVFRSGKENKFSVFNVFYNYVNIIYILLPLHTQNKFHIWINSQNKIYKIFWT